MSIFTDLTKEVVDKILLAHKKPWHVSEVVHKDEDLLKKYSEAAAIGFSYLKKKYPLLGQLAIKSEDNQDLLLQISNLGSSIFDSEDDRNIMDGIENIFLMESVR